jgi:transcriptional regulator with AAA-type ATPase domain
MSSDPTSEAAAGPSERRDLDLRFAQRFGRDPWLVGCSEPLRRLHAFLDRAAKTDLPVLILGPPGVGRAEAARCLHLLGSRRDQPFTTLDGPSLTVDGFDADLEAAVSAADGGTLFLASTDDIDRRLQVRLAQILNAGLAHWWRRRPRTGTPDVRLAASTGPAGGKGPARLLKTLRDELAFLSFEIEPLQARPEDLGLLALHFLRSYGCPLSSLPDEVEKAIRAYRWPGNLPELRHVMARMAAFTNSADLTTKDSQARFRSQLVTELMQPRPRPPLAGLIQTCARGSFEAPDGMLHPALCRSLVHIGHRFGEPMSLANLSRAAFVSPSHLSHLFAARVGLSPMAFLSRVRIERAKTLLEGPGLSVSQIAAQVGFGDLRHFERAFKRVLGTTPLKYRRHHEAGVLHSVRL